MTVDRARAVATAMLLLGAGIILLTFRDYGASWDEPSAAYYGELVLSYFTSGFQDLRANAQEYYRNYGAAFELLSASLYQFAPEWKYDIRHFLAALAGLGGVAGLMRFAGLFRDPWLPIFAGLALALLPRYYGHAFINAKDIPFACFFAWGMFTGARLFLSEERKTRDFVYCGLAMGLALSIRIGGFLLPAFLLAGLVFRLLPEGKQALAVLRRSLSQRLILQVGIMAVVTWIVMIAFWPFAHERPLLRPLETFFYMNAFPVSYPVLFEGAVLPSDQLPHRYLLQYLGITTPPASLFLLIAGLLASIRMQMTQPRSREAFLCSMGQLWLFFPIAFVWVTRPNVYDGLRHFLFILPALCLFAGLGATAILRLVGGQGMRQALTAAALIGLLLLPIKDLIGLHPYQMTYFNGLAGGLSGANARYETDYWATSYREAALWLNQKRIAEGKDHLTVLFAANPVLQDCFLFYLDPEIRPKRIWEKVPHRRLPSEVDYYVGISRYGYAENFPDTPVVHAIGRDGAVFSAIRSEHP